MNIKIVNFRPLGKNTLRGFLTIHFIDIGLVVKDVCLHQKDGKRWLQLPSRSYQKKDGTVAYAYVMEFEKKDYWIFQDSALTALDSYFSQNPEGK